jgi:hypothetical protein
LGGGCHLFFKHLGEHLLFLVVGVHFRQANGRTPAGRVDEARREEFPDGGIWPDGTPDGGI